jgi:hypothetical protein
MPSDDSTPLDVLGGLGRDACDGDIANRGARGDRVQCAIGPPAR